MDASNEANNQEQREEILEVLSAENLVSDINNGFENDGSYDSLKEKSNAFQSGPGVDDAR